MWKTIIENPHWEYSDTPNEDRKLNDTYDYDLHTKHVNGIRYNPAGDKIYVLAKQINRNSQVGYGEYIVSDPDQIKDGMLAYFSNKVSEDGSRFIDQSEGVGTYEISPGRFFVGDGVAYGKLIDSDTGADSSVTLNGPFKISAKWMRVNTIEPLANTIFWGPNASEIDSKSMFKTNALGQLEIEIDGSWYNSGVVVPAGVREVSIIRDINNELTYLYDGVAVLSGQACTPEAFIINRISHTSVGPLWDVYAATLDAEGNETPVFQNSLAHQAGSGKLLSHIGPHVQLVNYSEDNYGESNLYGHTLGEYDGGYADIIPGYGGYFTFDETAPASVKFRIDTLNNEKWLLDGNVVSSGLWHTVNKDTTREISLGTLSKDIGSIYFYNETWAQYTGVHFDLSSLSEMRPTGSLYLNNMPLVTGDLTSLSEMRPTGSLYLINMPSVTGCSNVSAFWQGSTSIRVDGCGINQQGIDNILASVATGTKTSGALQLQGGTNSPPSAAGLANKAILEGRGWTVTVNS